MFNCNNGSTTSLGYVVGYHESFRSVVTLNMLAWDLKSLIFGMEGVVYAGMLAEGISHTRLQEIKMGCS